MLLLLLFACDDTTLATGVTCALGAPTLSPSSAAPGDTVVVTVDRLTEVWDTTITVGPAKASVLEIDRSTCDACDDCQDTGACSVCEPCEPCNEACLTCVETVSFVVPTVEPGDWSVEVINRHGRSDRVTLTVTAATGDTATSAP